ncbi:MAG TPA: hypothetical protein VMK42_00465 [Anaeromyxobacteraceae bacterium]|nr:hypothetical protein [Anaeromyxobacteraceae bacterium]
MPPPTRQHAFRLSPEHEQIIDREAQRLQQVTGFQVSHADALRSILESVDRVERIREQRISSYRAEIARLEPQGPSAELERARQALNDWLTMSRERMAGLAGLQASGIWATGKIQREAVKRGLDKMSDEDIDNEIAAARRSRRRK